MGLIGSVTTVMMIGIAVVGLTVTPASASIVYQVNRTIGAGTVSGFIETDGTSGTLITANITDWELTLTAPNLKASPDVITMADAAVTQILDLATTATATQLTFNFSLSDASFFLLQGNTTFGWWCLGTTTGLCSTDALSESIGRQPDDTQLAQTVSRTGSVVFAEVSPVPLPAALPLFASALAGFGFFGWRRRKQEALA